MILLNFRGGGATRKTSSCCGLDLCYNLKITCLEASGEKFLRHSELDSESINADKDRLRLAGRSDEGGKIIPSSYRHPELAAKSVERESKRDFMPLPGDSESLNKATDSGSEAGMTGTESNILHRKVQSDEGSRTPCTPSRHSDGSQSLSMPVNLIRHLWQQKSRKTAFTMAEVLITLGIIGIVAAMTLPSLIGKYQKNVTVTRLQKAYSVLSQAINFAIKDNEDIEYWDFELSSPQFMERYIEPYLQNIASVSEYDDTDRYSKIYALTDGTTFYGWMYKNPNPQHHDITTFYTFYVDINGETKPNQLGRDQFIYYIFPAKSRVYNGGKGTLALNIPRAGLYPDGYGFDRETLKNYIWRGCNTSADAEPPEGHENATLAVGAYCTALIMLDGWKIADDYKW